MIRKVRISTITVPLMSMTPAVPVVTRNGIRLLGRHVRQEHEAECEVDEVHGFDQTHDREEPRDHSPLSLRLPRDAADESVARKAVAESGAYRAEADREAETDQRAGENKSVICHVSLLVVFVLETFTSHAEVDDREQHEDERLDEADEYDVEGFPDGQQDRA